MDFTGGYRNHFSSSMNYNYFSGNGFNLRQDLNSLIGKSPEKTSAIRSKVHETSPSLYFENEGRKRASSCPLPTPKNRFEHLQEPSPVIEEFPDNKLFELKSVELPEETLHILITGPPYCGKTRLLEILAQRYVQVTKDGGPSLAFNKSFAVFGMEVHVNIWYMKNPKKCAKSLKDVFNDKNFAIFLVYDVTVPKTLFDVREYILGFQRVFGVNVPIILVGNKTSMRTLINNELSMLDWGLLAYRDGQQVKEEYKLVDFVECTGETSHGLHDLLLKASTVTLGNYFKF